MKEFIEKILHQKVNISAYKDMDVLPLTFAGNYNLYLLEFYGNCCIVAEVKEYVGLATARKQYKRLQELTRMNCVLYFDKISAYAREQMLEEGISFIWEGHQLYMPFIGIWLKENEARIINECYRISFLTQKMLLLSLYESWYDTTVTMAAKKLQVSKMSVTRSFDEIESLQIPILYRKGGRRMIRCLPDKKGMWEIIKVYMREPVLREYYLKEDLKIDLPAGGISALCEYSILSDNAYPTYCITKRQSSELKMKEKKQIPKSEIPGCVVQEMGYMISYEGTNRIDPLSVMMVMQNEMDDPRVEIAITEMLEKYVW